MFIGSFSIQSLTKVSSLIHFVETAAFITPLLMNPLLLEMAHLTAQTLPNSVLIYYNKCASLQTLMQNTERSDFGKTKSFVTDRESCKKCTK